MHACLALNFSLMSGLAVVSPAIQLTDTAKQICDFWSSIKDALEEISTVNTDLELLSSVHAAMAFGAQYAWPGIALATVLESCTVAQGS